MLSNWKKPTLDAFIHVLAWCLAWAWFSFDFDYSPSGYGYATVSAWWCTLYVGYLRGIGLKSLVPLFFAASAAYMAGFSSGLEWFLDAYSASEFKDALPQFLFFSTPGAFITISTPILINSVVRYFLRFAGRDGAGIKQPT